MERGRSSVGRARRSQCRGQGFDPPRLHQVPWGTQMRPIAQMLRVYRDQTVTSQGILKRLSPQITRLILLPILAVTQVLGCTNDSPSLSTLKTLDPIVQADVEEAVQNYIRCSVATSIKIDDGKRHAGRLAWTATEMCESKKILLIQKMSQAGVPYDSAIDTASDSQVQAAAAGIVAIQTTRGTTPD